MSSPLLDLLVREHAAIGEFLELLAQESAAMTHGEFRRLPGLAEHKSQLADQIALIGRQREMAQQALGYAPGRSGGDAAAAAGGKTLQAAWRNLLACAAQAHECNHRNGVMVHTHLDYTRQSINFLKASGQPLYGPDGTHKAGSSSGHRFAAG
jgi:flagella synthesis protein FlgN